MPSPEDLTTRSPGHHHVVNAETIPMVSQRAAAPAYRVPSQPTMQQRRLPPQGSYAPYGPFEPQRGRAVPSDQGARAPMPYPVAHPSDPLYADVPRITTTQRPHRRMDTSVMCAAAALVLLGVAVLVGIML